jgi:hypothetical protein
MHHAFVGGALHFGLRRPQGLYRGRSVPAGNGRFNLLDEGSHARFPRLVAGCPAVVLPDALARGICVGHGRLLELVTTCSATSAQPRRREPVF